MASRNCRIKPEGGKSEQGQMVTEIDKSYHQSAVIPYRCEGDQVQILLITNRSGKRWVLPKGIIEDHQTELESAASEALEEAGIEGQIDPDPIGQYRYEKWGGICVVKIFKMKVENIFEDWPESFFRERKWVSLDEAEHLTDERIPRDIFQTFRTRIE